MCAAGIAHRDPDPCEEQGSQNSGNLAGDFGEIPAPPADLQHFPMGSRMRNGERLAEDMRALKVKERLVEMVASVLFDRRSHLSLIGLSKRNVHTAVLRASFLGR